MTLNPPGLYALDSAANFVVTPDEQGTFSISGSYMAAPGEKIVLGIGKDQLQDPPEGFIESSAGFFFIYLVGAGEVRRFEKTFRAGNATHIRMFLRRWYSDSAMFFNVDSIQWDEFIYVMGSCVSRDSFEYSGLPLSGYRARFSFSSVTSPPVQFDRRALEKNPSEFQRRMVEGDLAKTNVELASKAPGNYVLVDFIDERLPLKINGQSRFTSSPELLATDLASTGESLDMFSPDYFDLFEEGWRHFMAAMNQKTVILNKVFWATEVEGGEPLPNYELILKQNGKLLKLYDIVSRGERKPVYIEYPTQPVAAKNHKWGQSPFHFGEDFNVYQGEQLRALTSKRRLDCRGIDSPSTASQ
ncbi:DUF6270 domain-containing protein [Corynebacterium glaucum]|uniref:DUF6270 domain-containing protein n=1 Tax=Corynebacterium glaucum TaxID=187491 RepID=UPI0025B31C90|nr:DUF6270 domain-containing protein [Corynebacterium glaucum]